MKIYCPNIAGTQIGGGWTFLANFKQAMGDKVEFVDSWSACDVFLICGVTMIDKTEVAMAHKDRKKIVLRVDNMPRKSRNQRMSPHERMKEFAFHSDAIVYQSNWCKEWIGSYVGYPEKSHVILNGVDTNIFKPDRALPRSDLYKIFLYVHYNRDENKRTPEALDMFTEAWMKNPFNELWIVGRFSPDMVNAGFDFFRGEKVKYFGVVEDRKKMAEYMQKADILLFPSYSDGCPNTVIEGVACGMEVWHRGHAGVGEAASIADPSLDRMGKEYMDIFKKILL